MIASVGAVLVMACGGKSGPDHSATPVGVPIPSAMFAGQKVLVFPLTYAVAEERLGWQERLGPRDDRLDRIDGLLAEFLEERAPEVTWVLPDELRDAARRNPGLVGDPDRMGAAALRDQGIEKIPEPLASNLRTLAAVAGDRLVLVPTSLVFTEAPDSTGRGRVELRVVIVDVRHSLVRLRAVGYGTSDDPWQAVRGALDELLPITP